MHIIDRFLEQVATNANAAQPVDVRIGGHWSAVTVELSGQVRGGLSSTLGGGGDDHHHGKGAPVKDAGRLLSYSAAQLAALAHSKSLPETSVGFATINALLDVDLDTCVEVNAADVIAERGAGRNVAIVGHFPFIPHIRTIAKTLWVLELRPREGDLPASMAADVLPQADVIALTGTSLLNHTFDELIALCRQDAFVVMLGGTTPLSPVLFEFGVDAVAGTLLADPAAALLAVSQGATFPQIPGKRLLTMFKG
ncbi:MAG: Rossmann-like domain-containing protein [Anaerolineae bacterium]